MVVIPIALLVYFDIKKVNKGKFIIYQFFSVQFTIATVFERYSPYSQLVYLSLTIPNSSSLNFNPNPHSHLTNADIIVDQGDSRWGLQVSGAMV